MERPIVARDMMASNLVTLHPEMEVLEAIDVLLKHRISGAPVVDGDGRFLGIFSEKSCMQFVLDAAYDQLPTTGVMAFVDPAPPTIDEDTDLLTIAQTFLDAACRRLPVLDSAGRLRGQISRRDIMHAVREQLKQGARSPGPQLLYLSAVVTPGDSPW